jgi:hypothetical protein
MQVFPPEIINSNVMIVGSLVSISLGGPERSRRDNRSVALAKQKRGIYTMSNYPSILSALLNTHAGVVRPRQRPKPANKCRNPTKIPAAKWFALRLLARGATAAFVYFSAFLYHQFFS